MILTRKISTTLICLLTGMLIISLSVLTTVAAADSTDSYPKIIRSPSGWEYACYVAGSVTITLSGQINNSLGIRASPWDRVTINGTDYFQSNETFRNLVRNDFKKLLIMGFPNEIDPASSVWWKSLLFAWRDPTERRYGYILDTANGSYFYENFFENLTIVADINNCSKLIPIPEDFNSSMNWNSNWTEVVFVWKTDDFTTRKTVTQTILKTVSSWWYVSGVVDVDDGFVPLENNTEKISFKGASIFVVAFSLLFFFRRKNRQQKQ